jgi:lipoyl(octanoyl) transferase
MSELRGELLVVDLGLRQYGEALQLQRAVARARADGGITEDVLLLVEHPPVVTLGRSAKERHLLASPEFLASRGIELFEVERGGDITFHGPGQLVGYPVIDLRRHRQDLHWYLRQVEEALIVALHGYGLEAARNAGYTGVWVGGLQSPQEQGKLVPDAGGAPPRKIASIGVHARDWVTWHGFALNVQTDLSNFELIVPCGIQQVTMTSLERELALRGSTPSLRDAGVTVASAFAEVFELRCRWSGETALALEPAAAQH